MTTTTIAAAPTCSQPCIWRGARSSSRRPRIEAAFLRSILNRTLSVVDLTDDDYNRMAELVETYGDFPLGTTDAAVVAVAERLHIAEVATLDHRHFRAVRPRHTDAFTLLP